MHSEKVVIGQLLILKLIQLVHALSQKLAQLLGNSKNMRAIADFPMYEHMLANRMKVTLKMRKDAGAGKLKFFCTLVQGSCIIF